MSKLVNIKPERVFKYFEDISQIPRGSGNMERIAEFCVEFAKSKNLKVVCDKANNVIIYKNATIGYENSDTVILQGHLDMVCQKNEDVKIDFEEQGIDVYVDGDYLKARGTTLGGDNGIAVAMILAILEDKNIEHPAIEAVFTTDEEIGMIGAMQLDFSLLKGTKMINIDSEEQDVLTVSCAGGSDFEMVLPVVREKSCGTEMELTVKGLRGGHSGVEINSGRVNSNMLMARILNKADVSYGIISLSGGDKANAIPVFTKANIVTGNPERLTETLKLYVQEIKKEIQFREESFEFEIVEKASGEFDVINKKCAQKLIFSLLCAPNGVVEMSKEIENLVETSLNLGILRTDEDSVTEHFALRSNKTSALYFLEDRLKAFAEFSGFDVKTFGHYPPWEFKSDSRLQKIYREIYKDTFGREISVEAIHAGLECGVFASAINDIDCISVGPQMYDIHTPNERLSISSTEAVFAMILKVLKECK